MSYRYLDPYYYPEMNPSASGQLPSLGYTPLPLPGSDYNTVGVTSTFADAGSSIAGGAQAVVNKVESAVDEFSAQFGQLATTVKIAIYVGSGLYAVSLVDRFLEARKR